MGTWVKSRGVSWTIFCVVCYLVPKNSFGSEAKDETIGPGMKCAVLMDSYRRDWAWCRHLHAYFYDSRDITILLGEQNHPRTSFGLLSARRAGDSSFVASCPHHGPDAVVACSRIRSSSQQRPYSPTRRTVSFGMPQKPGAANHLNHSRRRLRVNLRSRHPRASGSVR